MKQLTGLFLGAGASYEAGLPLVWELTKELKEWLTPDKLREFNRGWRIQGGGYPDEVIEDMIVCLGRPEMHYETILGYLETQWRRHRAHALAYHGLYVWSVEMVYHMLYLRHVNNEAFLARQLSAYDGLRVLADENTPLWIFSLNHDVIIEAIAARLSIPLHSGFSPERKTFVRRDRTGKPIGEIQAEVLTQQEHEHGAMRFANPAVPGIYLLKIHGALDIFTFNDGKDLLKLLPNAPGQQGVIDVLRAVNEGLFYEIPDHPGAAKAANEICYPDEQGVMQFLRRTLLAGAYKFDARSQQVLPKSMLRHFQQNLNFVTTLVCIGYGFGDLHINLVIREWLEFHPDRRLEIVSPDARDAPAFLLHLVSQVQITAAAATDWLDNRAGIVRTSRERLERRIGENLRKLGKERGAEGLNAFIRLHRDQAAKGLAEKLRSLPVIDGQPDVAALGDPALVGKQWAAELHLTPEDQLHQLLQYLEAMRTGGQPPSGLGSA
ncbi:hypothetical protein UB31_35690 [Bradyrhizobium sp. LTSP849]|uniref:hypothetical protein n=1 Tax=Bradyrhizobium sp. LTSP849 TaxID=1615890 RepID=UPI0005D17A4C|nr:hypothetical protein [Bradyrhizobium sp. LTSP849]KJC36798.1 hypothetical protein UB31_35690 [Bradyrhizobium sp. LTSP849]